MSYAYWRAGSVRRIVSFLLMPKKEILGLLAPSIVFLWVTAHLFLYADFYTPGEKDQLRAIQQKKVAEMVRKIESGEYPTEARSDTCGGVSLGT